MAIALPRTSPETLNFPYCYFLEFLEGKIGHLFLEGKVGQRVQNLLQVTKCLVIEDSEVGIEAACKANMQSLSVYSFIPNM
ncbi:MAG: hypothetical protein PUP91_19870 [Rhizonema sp. PD37]|nr:hypothetical protein [Rhizonema sp. PD37]